MQELQHICEHAAEAATALVMPKSKSCRVAISTCKELARTKPTMQGTTPTCMEESRTAILDSCINVSAG